MNSFLCWLSVGSQARVVASSSTVLEHFAFLLAALEGLLCDLQLTAEALLLCGHTAQRGSRAGVPSCAEGRVNVEIVGCAKCPKTAPNTIKRPPKQHFVRFWIPMDTPKINFARNCLVLSFYMVLRDYMAKCDHS